MLRIDVKSLIAGLIVGGCVYAFFSQRSAPESFAITRCVTPSVTPSVSAPANRPPLPADPKRPLCDPSPLPADPKRPLCDPSPARRPLHVPLDMLTPPHAAPGACVPQEYGRSGVRVYRAKEINEHQTEFWAKVTTSIWEPNTFPTFANEIGPETVYIGFGEWIGPTGLFAGALGAPLLVLTDPDRKAFEFLKKNVECNPVMAQRIHVLDHCIIGSPDYAFLELVGQGDSVSRMSDLSRIDGSVASMPRYSVFCISLPRLIEKFVIPTIGGNLSNVFVKVDTEGAEGVIIPQLKPWLKTLGRDAPVFFISLHPTMSGWNAASARGKMESFLEVVHMFEFAGTDSDKMIAGRDWTVEKLLACNTCDLILRNGPKRGGKYAAQAATY